MTILEGLYGYEQALLFLGAILFTLAVFVVLYSVLKKEKIVRSIPLFVISIAMVGFPSIEKIEFENDKLAIHKQVHELSKSPLDERLKLSLQRNIVKVSERPNLAQETFLRVTFLQGMVYPNQFDGFVSLHRNRYTVGFLSCLSTVKSNLRNLSVEYQKRCNDLDDPMLQQKCERDNEYFKMVVALDSIESVIRGKKTWIETPTGMATSMAKKLLGEETYMQFFEHVTEMYENMLSCS